VVVKSNGSRRWLPNAMSWVEVKLTNLDGSDAAVCAIREKWFPQEALVENGTTEIPLRRVGDSPCLVKPNDILGFGGEW